MATATRICKVCGKEYDYCHKTGQSDGVFRWKDVACCPEHGVIYLNKVLESRAKKPEPKAEPVKETRALIPDVANQPKKIGWQRNKHTNALNKNDTINKPNGASADDTAE